MARQSHIAVLGGGIAGLAAAYTASRLARENGVDVRVALYEKSGRIGGKLYTAREGGLILELGADSMLARKRAATELCEELGLGDDLVGTGPDARRTYIVGDGVLHPFPAGTYMGIPVTESAIESCELLSAEGKRRALQDFTLPDGSPQDGSDESLGRALRRRLGDEMVDRIAEAVLSGIYGGALDEMSLLSTFPEFRQAEREHGSVLRGFAELLARARSHARGPAGKPGAGSVFVTLKGGLDSLVLRLAQRLQDAAVTVAFDTEATGLRRRADGRYELSLRCNDSFRDVVCDGVIVAAPAYAAAEILRDSPNVAAVLAGIPYTSVTSLSFVCQEAEIAHKIDGSGFVVPRTEGMAITACTWVSAKWPHASSDGEVILRCFLGRADGGEEMLARSDDELAATAARDMRALIGYTGPSAPRRMARWEQAMPQYGVGHSAHMDALDALLASELPAVRVAGAAYRGVGIADVIAGAQNAAREVFAGVASNL